MMVCFCSDYRYVQTRWRRQRAHALWPAVVASAVLLVASGAGFRVLRHQMERDVSSQRVEPGTLARLPLNIDGWVGRDATIEEAVIRTADVDDYVYRHYVHSGAARAVGLWVAYGVRARDLMPHRPEVCYPGAGWTLVDKQVVEVPLDGGQTLRAHIFQFSLGGVGPRPLNVLNFYIIDGETCEDVSLLRSRAWKGHGAVRYVAQVQITAQADPARVGELPEDTVREFAAALFPHLQALLQAIDPAQAVETTP